MTATLEERVAALRAAAAAARSIGLSEDAVRADEVANRIETRAGFGGATYVVALAGGTGVGKSSLLNAIARRDVSEVRAVRPTTDRPVAYVPEDRREELAPLLSWLGVDEVVTHTDAALADVTLVDLPDVDSVRREHRALVDELLPRIDAVWWLVDPEKYDDERAHSYWRSLARHAERMRFVLNKADRLTDGERELVTDDLRRRLVDDGIQRPVVRVVSAQTGEGTGDLRDELGHAGIAKAAVFHKLEADREAAAEALAQATGVDVALGYRPLVEPGRRDAAVADAVEGALALLDPPGVARQVQQAVVYRARDRGGSLLGRAVALLAWVTGTRRSHADPGAYLTGWRRRGTLGRALNPIRGLLVDAAAGVPPESRRSVLDALGLETAESAVEEELDRAAARAVGALEIGTSAVWTAIGLLQLAVGGAFVFALAWYVTLFLAGAGVPVATVEVPLLGPLPMPLVLLAGSVVATVVLNVLLAVHAGWVGRQRAGEMADRTRTTVREAVERVALVGLERVEEARRRIAAAAATGRES